MSPLIFPLEADYVYDAFGNRIQKTVDWDGEGEDPAEVEKYAYDGWNNLKSSSPVGTENWDIIADLDDAGDLVTRYVRGDIVDHLFARVAENGDTLWNLTDRLGSLRDVIDNSGAVVDTLVYDAFGRMTESDPEYGGRYKWTGREFDVETGLQFNRARYYDADTGRWISQDPLGFDGGDSNLYPYVANRPTGATDPSGFVEWQEGEIKGLGKTLTMSLAIEIVGKDGKILDQKQIDKMADAKEFPALLNQLFNNGYAGKIWLTSKDGKSKYQPRLNVHIAKPKEKVDFKIDLNTFGNLTAKGTPLGLDITEATWNKLKLPVPAFFGFVHAYSINHNEKAKSYHIELYAYPAVEKFVKGFFGLAPAEADMEFSILRKLTSGIVNDKGAFVIPRYFKQWEQYLNKQNAKAGFTADWDKTETMMKKLIVGYIRSKFK